MRPKIDKWLILVSLEKALLGQIALKTKTPIPLVILQGDKDVSLKVKHQRDILIIYLIQICNYLLALTGALNASGTKKHTAPATFLIFNRGNLLFKFAIWTNTT